MSAEHDYLTFTNPDYKGWHVRVIKDSVSPDGVRLATFEMRFPRIILAEFNTHRVFSRNSASSRAIPFEKMLKMVEKDPYVPARFPMQGSGMTPPGFLEGRGHNAALRRWMEARDSAMLQAELLYHEGVGKSIANRLLEPFMWHTAIVTGTYWRNFIRQRAHKDAQDDIRIVAELTQEALRSSTPKEIPTGGWHMPFIAASDVTEVIRGHFGEEPTPATLFQAVLMGGKDVIESMKRVSVARCARVSYLNHAGERSIADDISLYKRLASQEPKHFSPMEHVATPAESYYAYGNLKGWKSHRMEFENEDGEQDTRPSTRKRG